MTNVLTRHIEQRDQARLAVALRGGAYEGLRRALKLSPAELIAEVTASGLRGRGGAGFPTGRKWSFIHPQPGQPVYLLCNADESEPGTFKDHYLLKHDPHLVLEGIAIAAHAIGAAKAYLYMRGEYASIARDVQAALQEASAAGILGDHCLGTDFSLQIEIQLGAGAYICGEETGLIQSLEGKRAYPRVRPPFPAVHGFVDQPTVVNNVETLANLSYILVEGAQAFAALGTDRSTGTKLICISGAVARPGVYEVEMGYPLLEALRREAAGVRLGRRLKAIIPGGTSVPVLTAEEAAPVMIDYESMQAAGTMLGSGGMIVFDETADMPKALLRIAEFYAHESCGECTPCREGTGWMAWVLRRLVAGEGRPGDLELLLRVGGNIEGRTICGLGDASVQPVRSFLQKFRPEFEALLPPARDAGPEWQRHGHGPRTARHGAPGDEALRSEPVDGPPDAAL
ncbi:MAG: NADH-quinone oxidoreductase subunit NuoF [Thermaerobacter sp.]|nr:NADH-quinone oxidoreductase subunit NuoF [Thermaerobacter sp.]